MKIAFLIISISLMNAVSAYDLEKTGRTVIYTCIDFLHLRRVISCKEVKKILLQYKVSDEATLSRIPENDNSICVSEICNTITQDKTIVDTVDDQTILTAMKSLECLNRRVNEMYPLCKWMWYDVVWFKLCYFSMIWLFGPKRIIVEIHKGMKN